MDNISSSSAASQFRPHHSPWLHNTLAEVDAKLKTIMKLVEDDGETFAKRAEMYYQNKPQLLDLVQDLHKSYTVLAENHDHHLSTHHHHRVQNSDTVVVLLETAAADKEPPSDSPPILKNPEEDYSIVKAASPDSDDGGEAEEAASFWDAMKVVRDNESVLASFLRKYEEQRAEIGRLKSEIRVTRRLLDVERAEKQQGRGKGGSKFKKAFRRLLC
ncbi:protein NETWORKED 3C-like [Ipomoea triloba]|uniref:protein NETWORKED 3C-like n=1 Tax=Ipomoea triloba TaxID=35885 RepID=UPI00125DAD81|nr:protein NETWORKED 3C-like [Ipomoea triloba]